MDFSHVTIDCDRIFRSDEYDIYVITEMEHTEDGKWQIFHYYVAYLTGKGKRVEFDPVYLTASFSKISDPIRVEIESRMEAASLAIHHHKVLFATGPYIAHKIIQVAEEIGFK